MSRADTVNELIAVALDAMEQLPYEYSNQELLSASFTITLRIAQAVKKMNPELQPAIMQGLQVLLMQCADEDKRN